MKKRYVGWFLIACFVLTIVTVVDLGAAGVEKLSEPIKACLTAGVFCIIGLWIWMIVDFITRKNIKHRLAWGLSLIIFFTWGAAILYYILIYLRQPDGGTAIRNIPAR